ncbi:phosphate acyltransferase [Prolixibacter sp. SD074]|uniref:phosphate acyltransferase n=1 Tax=Prolixibacter sp. SD074 TaxID=2652391 RepID=UPI001298EFFB|nr:phosphate acyltransferase [Prolixibacter sp. SD074]
MGINRLEDLFDAVQGRPKRKLIAAYANDEHTIVAISKAIDLGLVEGILVGDEKVIQGVCRHENIDPAKFTIVHQPNEQLAATDSITMINNGEGDIIMKGLVSTDKFMRAILNKENGLLPQGAVLSHVTALQNPHYHKLIIASDVAIIPEPDLKQKVQMINYMVQTAKALGIDNPKVAAIAPTELVLPGLQSCSEAALLSKMNERGQIKGCVVDGPLALDAAIDEESAKIKGIKSEVAGKADCLLFPDLNAGNVFYKTNTKLAGAESAASLVGAKVPAVLVSRGDSIETKLYSIALAAMLAK